MKRWIILTGALLSLLASCSNKNMTLAERYEDDFLIGAAVTCGSYQSLVFYKSYKEDILKHFNYFVSENDMKPEAIYSTRGPEYYNFSYAEKMVEYAKEHGAMTKGHALVWHAQTPGTLISGNMSKEEARAAMKEYITTVVKHFGDDMLYWDVVNEALSDNQGEIYRTSSPWYQAYGGPEYIQDAFKFAREANPNAKLYYNDYSIVNPDKRFKAIKMIEDLELQKYGMDGIGMQGHWNLGFPDLETLERTIQIYGEMGLDVQITELDIDIYNGDSTAPEREYDEELENELADRYNDLYKVFEKNSKYIDSVTTWGVADDHSWLHKISAGKPLPQPRTNYPLLWDTFKKPKKALYKILDR